MTAEFDRYAQTYDEHLNKALAVSGEDKNFFAAGRIAWLAGRFRQLGWQPEKVLDYGCGTGSAVPFLFRELAAEFVVGVDVSSDSLAIARAEHEQARFVHQDELEPQADFDLAVCNGVFHHIPPAERAEALDYVRRSMRPGGFFAFFENNAWHPGTRYCMRKNVFDKNAIPIGPMGARRMLVSAGFEIVSRDFLFVFPRFLKVLRWTEPFLCRLPLGAQFLVLCRKRD